MANFFLDNKDLQFHLQHPLMRKIVALKERNYTLKDHHELAPQNFEDAMDNDRRVLEIAGEVCGEVIAKSAILLIGASGSVLSEMIIDDWSIPAVCWIWPEIPHAM